MPYQLLGIRYNCLSLSSIQHIKGNSYVAVIERILPIALEFVPRNSHQSSITAFTVLK
jgi:hypothetical protein